MTCISDLNKRLVIERPQQTPDGVGGADTGWVEFASVWAGIKPRFAGEKLHGDVVYAKATHTITIRHLAGLKPDMRFRLGSRIFEILSIINVDETDRWLKCFCSEQLL